MRHLVVEAAMSRGHSKTISRALVVGVAVEGASAVIGAE